VVLLVEILAGQALVIDRRGKDRFGRTLAYIRVSGADVGEMLIRARVAVRWEGRQHDWCNMGEKEIKAELAQVRQPTGAKGPGGLRGPTGSLAFATGNEGANVRLS
jgi:hypothetical protein